MHIPVFARVLFLLPFLAFGLPVVFADSLVQATPELLDFGEVRQGDPINVQFQLENSGTQARTIQFIDFSEPGLFAAVSPRIGAGDATVVKVRWNTANLAGVVEGVITLEFDGREAEPIVIRVHGTVLENSMESAN